MAEFLSSSYRKLCYFKEGFIDSIVSSGLTISEFLDPDIYGDLFSLDVECTSDV